MKYTFFLFIFYNILSCTEIVPDITSNLVIDIPLDGTAYEKVTNSIGIIKNATPTTNRHNVKNMAMQFYSIDSANIDFGDLPNASFSSNKFTISCWVFVSDTSKKIAVVSKRGTFGPFEYSLDNHFNNSIFNLDNWIEKGSTTVFGIDPLKASIPILLNSWHHFAIVADSIKMNVYLDGYLQSGTDIRNLNKSFSHTPAHFVIGNGGGYNKNYYFNGAIDDLKMYNMALDALTIKYLSEL